MARLNRGEPYAQVAGIPGVAWQQGGRLFNPAGVEVDENGDVLEGAREEPEPIEASDDDVPLEDKHWKHLKALVEMYGGTWTNRAEAIAYLKGHQH